MRHRPSVGPASDDRPGRRAHIGEVGIRSYLPVFYAPPAARIGHALLVAALSVTLAPLLRRADRT